MKFFSIKRIKENGFSDFDTVDENYPVNNFEIHFPEFLLLFVFIGFSLFSSQIFFCWSGKCLRNMGVSLVDTTDHKTQSERFHDFTAQSLISGQAQKLDWYLKASFNPVKSVSIPFSHSGTVFQMVVKMLQWRNSHYILSTFSLQVVETSVLSCF